MIEQISDQKGLPTAPFNPDDLEQLKKGQAALKAEMRDANDSKINKNTNLIDKSAPKSTTDYFEMLYINNFFESFANDAVLKEEIDSIQKNNNRTLRQKLDDLS